MILKYYENLGAEELIEHIFACEDWNEDLVDTLWYFASQKDETFAIKIENYKITKDEMDVITMVLTMESLIEEALAMFGYRWDRKIDKAVKI